MKEIKKCKWFELHELLPPEVYRGKDDGWELIDDRLKEVIDVLRGEIIKAPLICNTWWMNGNRKWSGYRTANCPVGTAKSQHKLGKAVDLLCYKYSAEQMRQMIEAQAEKLPYPVRIEKGVSWLHIDVKDMDYKGKKIYFFNA